MTMNIKVNIKMVKGMVTEHIFGKTKNLKDKNMLVIGKIIACMEKGI